jgi:hypoxanthine phosphoribosyltransferase
MVKKEFISAQQLLEYSFLLGKKIADSRFTPDFLVAIWRGGTPVGIAVQEFLARKGVQTDHIAIRTSAYEDIGKLAKTIRVHNLGYLKERVKKYHKLLLIDDVFDSGLSIEAIIRALRQKLGKNLPTEIRVATVYFKPESNQTSRVPDYFIHTSDAWLVFPHELQGLSPKEIAARKGRKIWKILK